MESIINLIETNPWIAILFALALIVCLVCLVLGARDLINGNVPAIPVVLMIGAIMLLVVVMHASDKPYKWEAFKRAHSCNVISKSSSRSNTSVGLMTGGSVMLILGDEVPEQVGYLCDDGVTYWVNE